MAPPILSLSGELHLLIFGKLNDLDDARDLARTCTYFYDLQRVHKQVIAKNIILTSDVYEYDVCVAQFHFAEQDLARIYEQFGANPKPQHRPQKYIFYKCTSAKRNPETVTFAIVHEICARWQKTRLLRELYLNDRVFDQFERFRKDLIAENADDYSRITSPVKPGFRFVKYMGPPPERTLAGACDDYTARFHRSLCLHSIGVSSRIIANSIQVTGKDVCDMLGKACQAWIKQKVTIGGHTFKPSMMEKVDSIETWDFVYNFLLRKLFPLNIMSTWMRACRSHHMLQDDFGGVVPSDVWSYHLTFLQWCLHPDDIVDAIVGRAWVKNSKFGGDKYHYMAIRGYFDIDANSPEDVDFYASLDRHMVVENLRICKFTPYSFDYDEDQYSWDWFRARQGSPFNPDFDWDLVVNGAREGMSYEDLSYVL